MNNLEKICKIMARGLLDIRLAAYEDDSKKAFALADLLHNVPSAIATESARGGDYGRILKSIYERAEDRGITTWVERALSEGA